MVTKNHVTMIIRNHVLQWENVQIARQRLAGGVQRHPAVNIMESELQQQYFL